MNTYIKLEWTKYPTQKAEIVRLDLKKKKKKDPIYFFENIARQVQIYLATYGHRSRNFK